jgi:hypothetical protein
MQFLTHNNAPQSYHHLVESNFLHKDDNNQQIHKPFLAETHQANRRFHTNFNSKTTHDQFDYRAHTLDNYYDPVNNETIIPHSNIINNRNPNPYRNGDAQQFFNPNLPYSNLDTPYANNYGTYHPTDVWDPYLNPQKNLSSYLSQQVVKENDRKRMVDLNRDNQNTNFPGEINPYKNFINDFNPGDNYVNGDSNANLASGNNLPLNKLMQSTNKNVPPDAPSNIDTNVPSESVPKMNLAEISLQELLERMGKTGLDTINDLVRWTEADPKDWGHLWNIFTKPDRIGYLGILIIIITVLLMIFF